MFLALRRHVPKPIKRIYRAFKRRSLAMRYYAQPLKLMRQWIWRDTEWTNFYFKLTPHNKDHLAQLVATVSGQPYQVIAEYIQELENDSTLRDHLTKHLRTPALGMDIQIEYGRRLGWYAFTRVLKPKVVIETGVDHGVGSCVLASALMRNAAQGFPGEYFGTDLRSSAGEVFSGEYAKMGRILYGDSITSLKAFDKKLDLFINDSDHSAVYEYDEYVTIADKLSGRGIILGDNSHVTDSLSRFSRERNRQFVFFSEKPENHWYPGAGIGISFLK